MKRLIAVFLLISLLLCGCDILETQKTIHEAEEQLLRAIVENEALQTWIQEHPFDEVAADAKENLLTAFPALEKLLNFDNVHDFFKTRAIEMTQEYLASSDPAAQKRAETLGELTKILFPDLTDEVDAALGR